MKYNLFKMSIYLPIFVIKSWIHFKCINIYNRLLIIFFLNLPFNSFPRENKSMQAPRTSIEPLCMFSKIVYLN